MIVLLIIFCSHLCEIHERKHFLLVTRVIEGRFKRRLLPEVTTRVKKQKTKREDYYYKHRVDHRQRLRTYDNVITYLFRN